MKTKGLTPIEVKILSLLSKTGSTWVLASEAKMVDVQKGILDGLLVMRKKKNIEYITLTSIFEMEKFCARQIVIKALKPAKQSVEDERLESLISDFENNKSESFHFSKEQKDGIKMMVNSNLCILTGGPGTGKTSVLECVAYVLKHVTNAHIGIQFTAPTGKAAKRITESSGYDAITIQRYTGGLGKSLITRRSHDYLFCDESSMTDLETLDKMMKSLFKTVSLYLIGDINQLPSVGLGAVLRDMIDSGFIPYVNLTQTFRQDESSVLFQNIQLVNDGCPLPLSDGSDFVNIRTEENALEACINSYLLAVNEYGINESIILCPYKRKGSVCANKLNEILQAKLNPSSLNRPILEEFVTRDNVRRRVKFIVEDPVISLVNSKDNVANGEVGTIASIENDKVIVKYEDGYHAYTKARLSELDLAYALSIHKAQGSEYKCAILPFLKENKNLDRNMIYTGISRAKKKCIVIGEPRTISEACKKQTSFNRITFFREELLIAKKAFELQASVL